MESELYLCENVDLDSNYNYTIDFDNLEAQHNYFLSKVFNTFLENSGYSYIRDTQILKVYENIDNLKNVNYLFYENNGKIYYAFIDKKDYVSSNCTALTFKIDVMQTFMFDYELKESFVEREHQDRYTKELKPIYSLTSESLDCGSDYNISNVEIVKDNQSAPDNLVWVEIISTQPLSTGTYSTTDNATLKNRSMRLIQNNIRSNVYCYLFPKLMSESYPKFYTYAGTGEVVEINSINIDDMLSEATCILSKRILTYSPIKYTIENYNKGHLLTFESGYTQTNVGGLKPVLVVTANNDNFGGVDLSGLGGYYLNLYELDKTNLNDEMFTPIFNTWMTPILNINNLKNMYYESKLYTYPYQYLQLSDNQTNPLIVKNEFLSEDSKIKVVQSVGVTAKLKVYVDNYCGDTGKFYNLTNATINELPLMSDAYISYLSQSKATATTGVAINTIAGVGSLAFGIATGGLGLVAGLGVAGSIGMDIANQMLQKQDLKQTPDNVRVAGNNAEFDILDNNFKITKSLFTIKEEFYKRIFNYLYHYGYACNNFKTPDLKSRYYFNYIKTIGVVIKTGIDNVYKQQLEDIYNNGVTLWHYRNANTFKGVNNYDYENVETNLMEVEEVGN